MTTHGARHARTGWVGWVYFAAAVLLVAGVIQIVNGVVAFAHSGTAFLTPSGMPFQVSYSGIGWSFLVTGVLLAATGIGVLRGRTWARAVGIAIAVISVLANIAFFAANPLWSAVIIALDVVVIYALALHGREVGRR